MGRFIPPTPEEIEAWLEGHKKKKGLNLMSIDNLLHMFGGAGIAGAFWLAGQPPIVGLIAALLVGFGREIGQHLDRPFPYLNLHNVGEALSWFAGAGLVGLGRWLV